MKEVAKESQGDDTAPAAEKNAERKRSGVTDTTVVAPLAPKDATREEAAATLAAAAKDVPQPMEES